VAELIYGLKTGFAPNIESRRGGQKKFSGIVEYDPLQIILAKRSHRGQIDVVVRILRGMIQIRNVNERDSLPVFLLAAPTSPPFHTGSHHCKKSSC
jgi:hypothetical protein